MRLMAQPVGGGSSYLDFHNTLNLMPVELAKPGNSILKMPKLKTEPLNNERN